MFTYLTFGIGSEAIKNGSNVTDTLLHREQTKVDLNYPWKRSQIIDSFLKRCLFQASALATSSDFPSDSVCSTYGFLSCLKRSSDMKSRMVLMHS